MKIAHICLCGLFSEKYAYQENLLAKYHEKLGHEVTIIAPTYCEFDLLSGKIIIKQVGIQTLNNGIRVIRLRPILPYSINKHVHLFSGFYSVLKKDAYDLLFVHGIDSPNYRVLARYKLNYPTTKIVVDNHADINNSCHTRLSLFWTKYFIKRHIADKISSFVDRFYGVTPARCDFLTAFYGIPSRQVKLLPLGADDDELHLDMKGFYRKAIRFQYNINENDFLIVTGGKIDKVKNIHALVQAISCSNFKKIKILVFGAIRDDMKMIFEEYKSENIQYIGWVPSNEVYKFFHAADVVIFPGLHSVLWEQAVASKVPCAFSKIDGFEHINICNNCILLEKKDAIYYQKIIEKLYLDKNFYSSILNNSHCDLTKQFLYSNIAQKVIDDINFNQDA